jgi:alkanesulfonate monooxygenase SsuD/methylene tetrahydromethanopterin reductase-like flavin-dependent oxidoreductase (luciferase family)
VDHAGRAGRADRADPARHADDGVPFPAAGERFDRLEEQLEIVTGLWATPAGERFSFHGKHYRLTECASLPRPAQSRVPVIIGGTGPRRTPALAARFADEFNSGLTGDIGTVFGTVRRACEQAGRDPATLRYSAVLPVCCGTTPAQARRRAEALGEPGARLLGMGVVGVPGDVAARLDGFAAAGADTVYFHIYDVADTDHVRLLGTELVSRVLFAYHK